MSSQYYNSVIQGKSNSPGDIVMVIVYLKVANLVHFKQLKKTT